MAEEPATAYSDEEFLELLGFLSDAKMEVQRFAAEGVLAQTESQHFLDFCRRQPRKVAKPLLRLAEKAEADAATSGVAASLAAGKAKSPEEMKAARLAAMEAVAASSAGSSALQALVNISTVPTVRDELVELSAPRRVAEAMKSGWLEGRSGLAHWYSMLLANISTCKKGQEALCADETMLRFLVAAYTAKNRPPPRDGMDDPLICLGKVLGNLCALEAGRKILGCGDQAAGTVSTLAAELGDRPRRHDVLTILRNLALDNECHAGVIAADLLPRLAKFLYPWSQATPEQQSQLPEALRTILASEGAALTGEAPVRLAAAFCLLGLCRTREGREHLRANSAVEVVRAWQAEEGEDEIRNALEALAPALSSSEEELEAQQAGSEEGPIIQDVTDIVNRANPSDAPAVKEEAAEAEGDMSGLFEGIEGAEDGGDK